MRPTALITLCGFALSTVSGCAVGPDYKGPPNAAPVTTQAARFHRQPSALVSNTPPLASWWTALSEPTLDEIELQALRASPTLAAAEASVRNARATLHERQAALLPNGGVEALGVRARAPKSVTNALAGETRQPPADPVANLYAGGLDATWQLDIFGGTRRRIESARATADYQQAELEDAQVTLTADVAQAYVNLRDRQQRLDLTLANLNVQHQMLELTRQRRAGGTATDLDVERTITQVKQTESDIPTLRGEVEIYTDQLAQLAGQEPGSLENLLSGSRMLPLPPVQTALGDPAAFIRRRPDIRAAERQLAANNALIGYNIAEYFPQVTLVGTIGYVGIHSRHLIGGDSLTYAGGPSISWNVLNFPQITAQVAEARAAAEAASEQYRSTVLMGLRDAENSLSRFGHQRENVSVLDDAFNSAQRSAQLAKLRFAGGTISQIDMLDVDRQRLQTQTNLVKGRAMLTADWVALQSSLGLGWDDEARRADIEH